MRSGRRLHILLTVEGAFFLDQRIEVNLKQFKAVLRLLNFVQETVNLIVGNVVFAAVVKQSLVLCGLLLLRVLARPEVSWVGWVLQLRIQLLVGQLWCGSPLRREHLRDRPATRGCYVVCTDLLNAVVVSHERRLG